MATITTRSGKGSPLTNNEVDANFNNLNTDKAELSGAAFTGAITTNSTFDGRDVATDGTKLDGIESGATADQTAAQIKTLYESNSDTNAFTDADHSKLDGIEASADVTDTTNVSSAGALMDSEVTNLAQVKAFDSSDYATATQGTTADAALPKSGGAMTGAITTNSTFDGRDVATDGTKLDGIEASADVTDATNVTAAGALMDSELTSIASVKALNQGVATTDSPDFAALNVNGTATMDVLTVDTDTLHVDATNNRVGIGENSTLLGKLHVKTADSGATVDASADELVIEGSGNAGMSILSGASSTGSIYFGDSGTNWDGYIAYSQASRSMTFGTAAGGGSMKLDSSGNVGIAKTSLATWSSGYNALQVGGRGFVGAHTSSDLYVGQNASFNGGWKYEASVAASMTQHSGGKITQFVAPAGTAGNAISWNTAIDITSNGNVGIGGSPSKLLHLSETSDGTKLRMTLGGVCEWDFSISGTSTLTNVGSGALELLPLNTGTANEFAIGTAGQTAPLFHLTNSQNYFAKTVLVGTTSVSAGASSGKFVVGFAGNTANGIKVYDSYASAATNNAVVFIRGSSEVGSITTTTSATAYNTSSDYRLKEDWQPVENATDRLKELKPCNFAWKVDGSRVDGFLAHELQEVVPEAVTGKKDAMQTEEYEVTSAVYEDVVIPAVEAVEAEYDEEGNVVVEAVEAQEERTESQLVTEAVMGEREVPDYQGIDQSKLVPLLVATIQELEARITQLESN